MKVLNKIFSIKNSNNNKHKIIRIAGLKIKVKKTPEYNNRYLEDFNKIPNITSNEWCTGCSACKNVCKHNAIEMRENDEGFLVPFINLSKCTNCGLCNKICPIINFKEQEKKAPDCYAMQANDDIRLISSSGGFFSLASKYVLNQGGYVCGVKYSEDFYSVEHTIISDIKDLEKLLISKYVQSDLNTIFRKIKELLGSNKLVLFSGTPCQVAGLKAYLRKDYQNLLLLDLVCCGIPSRKVYRKLLDEIRTTPNEKITGVKFRLKDKGWYTRAIEIKTTNKIYRQKNQSSAYQQLHFRGLSTNKICSICPYDTYPREGDITIGDFWHIEKFNKKLNDDKGTSLIFANTTKGTKLINAIKKDFKLLN